MLVLAYTAGHGGIISTLRNPNQERSVPVMTIISNTKLIKLTQGKFAIVDEENYDLLSQHNWHVRKSWGNYYAVRNVLFDDGRRLPIDMHRIIMGAKSGQYVDHINQNSLDNRRCNLRICSNAENARNSKKKMLLTLLQNIKVLLGINLVESF